MPNDKLTRVLLGVALVGALFTVIGWFAATERTSESFRWSSSCRPWRFASSCSLAWYENQ